MVRRYKNERKNSGLLRAALQALALLLLLVVPVSAELVDRIVADVNGEIILQSEVSEKLFQLKSSGRLRSTNDYDAEKEVLQSMIDEKLVIQFGKQRGIKITTLELDGKIREVLDRMGVDEDQFEQIIAQEGLTIKRYREMLSDQLLAMRVMTIEVRSQVTILPEAMEEYFAENAQQFLIPVTVKTRHILFELQKNAPKAESKIVLKRIKALRKKIVDGSIKFSDAASRYSQGPSSADGGNLGYVGPGQMVKPFEKVAFSLKVGRVSRPVRTRFGWHIILVEERTQPRMPTFEEAKETVKNRMYMDLVNEVRDDWMKVIRKQATVRILTEVK